MTDDPTETVRKLLISGQGVPEAKVTPQARILHDLGVDGDDAGEVFQALHVQFGTDFTELNRQWRTFFNTEGVSPRAMLFGVIAIIIIGGGTGALVAGFHWPKIVGIILTLTLLVGCGGLLSRWFDRDLQPLTVEGLAEIVREGRWPTNPADVR